MIQILENIGQALDFSKPYIVTANVIIVYISFSDYVIATTEILELGEIPEGHNLYYNSQTGKFYTHDTSSTLDA